jgi:predicted DNA binding CopG/RHH family protein
LPPELKRRRVNIALSSHWYEAGKKICVEKGLSFSGYIEWLIYTDSLCNESVE